MGICSGLFIKVVNMSITGSFVILAVLVLRALLCRAPKRFSYMLWGMVLFRLLCPVTMSSEISLLDLSGGAVTENGEMAYLLGTFAQGENTAQKQSTQAKSGENAAQKQSIQAKSEGKFARSAAEGIENVAAENLGGESAKRREDISKFGSLIWMMGVGTFLCFGAASAIRLQPLVSCSLKLRENVYLADGIASPFVLGLLHPRIYLPSSIEEKELSYVILHEQSHIARKDYLVKILAFLALSLHWFNPLVWLAFALSGKDMEMSCDEAVMRKIDGDVRAEYAMSLLHFTLGKRMGGMPLGFGAGDVKSRIKNVMNYKKPAGAAIVLGALACLLGGACLLTNPKSENIEPAKKYDVLKNFAGKLLEEAIQTEVIETDIKIGLPIALPDNDVSMQDCQVKKNEENYLEIQYYDGILDGYCTLWAVKDGSLDLPEAAYEKELEETWEGHTLAERRVEVKVQHASKQVLATWEYENYKFAIIGKAVPGEDGTDSVPKTALGIIMQLP